MGIWSLISTVLAILAKWIGVGQPDPMTEGEKLGKAETTAQDQQGELQAIAKADAAKKGVSDAPDQIVSDPNNAGP